MIQAKYNRFYNRLSVRGHAGSADKGEDLICSAASILVHTLAANVEHMQEAGIVTKVTKDIRDGDAVIGCVAAKGYGSTVASTYQSVCVGFEILASKFPEYISFKICG